MILLAAKWLTSSVNENESWTVNSLTVKDAKIGTKNLTKLYVGVTRGDKMKPKVGQLSMTIINYQSTIIGHILLKDHGTNFLRLHNSIKKNEWI